jgi:hypothetical protein
MEGGDREVPPWLVLPVKKPPSVATTGETFTVDLPVIPGGSGHDNTIQVPNGRPIYALFLGGYMANRWFDELYYYRFAWFLMSKGAYVHWARWNNLLEPYMARPLHSETSNPGDFCPNFFGFDCPIMEFTVCPANKADPRDDFQFVSDAGLFLHAIRENNPSAMIIVVGHSMGGSSVVRLAEVANLPEVDVVIDILAPIDPVGNRSLPCGYGGNEGNSNRTGPWTRWRIHYGTLLDEFRGYLPAGCGDQDDPCDPWTIFSPCNSSGNWIPVGSRWYDNVASADLACLGSTGGVVFIHDPPQRGIGRNVINLHHRWQHEHFYPFDIAERYEFDRSRRPSGSLDSQIDAVTCTPASCGFGSCANDGHGEIVGHRGNFGCILGDLNLDGLKAENWAAPGDADLRRSYLEAMESAALSDSLGADSWYFAPKHPERCLVSNGLIARFRVMNKPPSAEAGSTQIVECTSPEGAEVTLVGSGSSDPDGDTLQYLWRGPFGFAAGESVTVNVPFGSHAILLEVEDVPGHIDRDEVIVKVVDTTPPEMTVTLSPNTLWPPNHRLVNVDASVSATDRCGDASVVLVSVVSNEDDNSLGDGDTPNDIRGANRLTEDYSFQVRAERSGEGDGRVYSVTYRATDESANSTELVAEVHVPHDRRGTALAGGGFAGDGSSLDVSAERFALVLLTDPSIKPGFDTRDVTALGACVGTTAGVVCPVESWRNDINGDGHEDLALFYSSEEAREIAERSDAIDGPLGLHYMTNGGDHYVVPDVFTLGKPIDLEGYHPNARIEEPAPVELPELTGLTGAYPNPFRPSVTIAFTLGRDEDTRITIYDVRGVPVRSLVERSLPAGRHQVSWNGREDSGRRASSGVYFAQIVAGDYVSMRKVVLLK